MARERERERDERETDHPVESNLSEFLSQPMYHSRLSSYTIIILTIIIVTIVYQILLYTSNISMYL